MSSSKLELVTDYLNEAGFSDLAELVTEAFKYYYLDDTLLIGSKYLDIRKAVVEEPLNLLVSKLLELEEKHKEIARAKEVSILFKNQMYHIERIASNRQRRLFLKM